MEIRLSVEDSPNSAACVVDAIRFAKSALDRGEGGPLLLPSAYYCKHPPQQMEEKLVREVLNDLASQPRGLKVSDANSGNLTEATT
jgi:myo-inositol-1-phosphate synthase